MTKIKKNLWSWLKRQNSSQWKMLLWLSLKKLDALKPAGQPSQSSPITLWTRLEKSAAPSTLASSRYSFVSWQSRSSRARHQSRPSSSSTSARRLQGQSTFQSHRPSKIQALSTQMSTSTILTRLQIHTILTQLLLHPFLSCRKLLITLLNILSWRMTTNLMIVLTPVLPPAMISQNVRHTSLSLSTFLTTRSWSMIRSRFFEQATSRIYSVNWRATMVSSPGRSSLTLSCTKSQTAVSSMKIL